MAKILPLLFSLSFILLTSSLHFDSHSLKHLPTANTTTTTTTSNTVTPPGATTTTTKTSVTTVAQPAVATNANAAIPATPASPVKPPVKPVFDQKPEKPTAEQLKKFPKAAPLAAQALDITPGGANGSTKRVGSVVCYTVGKQVKVDFSQICSTANCATQQSAARSKCNGVLRKYTA